MRPTFGADLRWGLQQGLTFAGALALLAAVGFALGAGAGLRLTFGEVLVLYALAGGLAGTLAGACRPFLTRRPVAVAVGACAMVPVALSYRWMSDGALRPGPRLVSFVVPAALFGAFTGLMIHDAMQRRSRGNVG